jgi:hypothetical protein
MNIALENMVKYYSERNVIMRKQLAKVLAASTYEESQNAAKEAFVLLADHYDPFKPDVVQAAEEARKAS